ncbi:MAG: alternative ribosome rescue factor ArfA [Cardiobacterium sp.]
MAPPFFRGTRAVQMRTAFGDAPCLKLSVDGYKSRLNVFSGGFSDFRLDSAKKRRIIRRPLIRRNNMNRRSLHQDLLHSGKYRQQIVKAKKGKGAFSRHDKHKKHRHEQGGVSFWGCGRRLTAARCGGKCRYSAAHKA